LRSIYNPYACGARACARENQACKDSPRLPAVPPTCPPGPTPSSRRRSESCLASIRIRLDAELERPNERTAFRHKFLRSWVHEHCSELVWACLTLIRAWQRGGTVFRRSPSGHLNCSRSRINPSTSRVRPSTPARSPSGSVCSTSETARSDPTSSGRRKDDAHGKVNRWRLAADHARAQEDVRTIWTMTQRQDSHCDGRQSWTVSRVCGDLRGVAGSLCPAWVLARAPHA
jgi:hypothetical protein